MKPVKDLHKINRMFEQGQITIIDSETGYRFTITAKCPKDGYFASIFKIERREQALSNIIFECPICFHQFEANRDELYIR